MVGCAAPFCNNSVVKDYIMKTFPRNAERRALWTKNVSERYWGNGVKNWMPVTNSFLCEVHFAPDMWEPRTDVQKLKSNAYPTIFGYFLKKKPMENNAKQVLTENNQINNLKTDSNKSYQPINIQLNESIAYIQKQGNVINDVSKCNTLAIYSASYTTKFTESNQSIDNIQLKQSISDIEKQECQVIDDTFETNTSMICPDKCLDKCNEREERYKKLENVNRKLRLNIIKMRKKMKILKNTIYILKNKSSNKYKKALQSVFTDCQIKALFTKNYVRMWSNDTIQRALQLKFVCGNNGYKELIRQGYPLPNVRTLQRRLEDF